ncbi:hypothetical protein DFH06DRAFT_1170084 [Mycena polygramma]|nr:hypothetical protein DFH06DRAFT_1170084 [Mycena polygramma]
MVGIAARLLFLGCSAVTVHVASLPPTPAPKWLPINPSLRPPTRFLDPIHRLDGTGMARRSIVNAGRRLVISQSMPPGAAEPQRATTYGLANGHSRVLDY